MSRYKDDGRMISAINAEAKARDLERKGLDTLQQKIASDPKVKAIKKELRLAEERVESSARHLAKAEMDAAKKIDLSSVRDEIARLRKAAQEADDSIPAYVQDHIERMCSGVDHGGPLTIVWFNRDFVIIRRPGRTGWGGVGMRRYAEAETGLYDLKADAKRHGTNILPVKEARGRMSQKEIAQWIKDASKK